MNSRCAKQYEACRIPFKNFNGRMKLAITDACIFIDLIELRLTSEFFKLPIEIHTSLDVYNELYPEQKEILIPRIRDELITFYTAALARYNLLSSLQPALAIKIVLVVTREIKMTIKH